MQSAVEPALSNSTLPVGVPNDPVTVAESCTDWPTDDVVGEADAVTVAGSSTSSLAGDDVEELQFESPE